jgi:hypothetical protein
MQLNQDDEAEFARVRRTLLDGFGDWLNAQGNAGAQAVDEASVDAGIALDWKFSYGDGHLGRWTAGDVTEFLLSWCPRKLSVSQADSMTIPGNLAALTDYLAANGLLAAGSSPAKRLRATAIRAAEDFAVAMADPANFGLAKSIFSGALTGGVDPADEGQLAEWVAGFNELSDEEREAILPGSAFGAGSLSPFDDGGSPDLPAGMSLRPVALPLPEAVAASEAAAPVLRMFAELARYVGAGRRLTQRGNLSVADARALVPLLGTGDMLDEQIGRRTFTTRSSAELPVLYLIFTWAKKAGMLRVQHGKVLATKRGLALARTPGAEFGRVLDALLAAGPLAAQRAPGDWFGWSDVDKLLDGIVPHLLVPVYSAREPVPVQALAELAARVVLQEFVFDGVTDESVAVRVSYDVARIMAVLELAGILRRFHPAEPGPEPERENRLRTDGSIQLTVAGVAALQKRLPALGYEVPVSGLLSAGTAAELIAALDPADIAGTTAEVDAWLARRTPEEAAAELAAALTELPEPALQSLALALLTDLGPELAAPQLRQLAGSTPARGLARAWLADHGMLDPLALFDPGDLDSFAQVLWHRLSTAGPAGMLATLALAGGDGGQEKLVSDLGRSPSSAADMVLEAIGASHAVKTVTKAARKALFLRRSRAAAGS